MVPVAESTESDESDSAVAIGTNYSENTHVISRLHMLTMFKYGN
jgi:hypothetical protein